ncbi:MAG: hypothetical protein CL906_02700 [Dehalococcoidia bacterium]|nr:hypothetical protein [Dehalococcoidia bacterium]
MISNFEYKNFCILVAEEAGKFVMNYFDKDFEVFSKDTKNNLVTEVDKGCQELIKNKISNRFPDHSIIGEEDGDSSLSNISEFTWVIDPIDGTTNFANGLPNFSISIGLLKNSEPIAGSIWIPWPNENRCLIFSTAKDEGSWIDNRKIDINNPQFSLGEGAISSYSSFSPIFGNKSRKIKPMNIRLRGDKRVIGSVAYEMAMLTKGVISFALLGPAFIWDFGAGLLLIKEAGGVVLELDNNYEPKSEFTSFLNTNYQKDEETFEKLKNWTGKFIAGNPDIMKLNNHEKFV